MENLEEALFRTPAQRWLSLTRNISETSRRLARASTHILLALVAAAAALGLAHWNGWLGAARREAPPWALPPPQVRTAARPSAAESPLPAPWRAAPAPGSGAPAPPKMLVVPEKISKAPKPPVPEPEEEAPEAPAAPAPRPHLVQAHNFVDVASELPAIAGEGHPQTYDGILRRFDGVAEPRVGAAGPRVGAAASRRPAAPPPAAVPNFARSAAAAAEQTEAPREREQEAKPDVLKLAAPALGGGAAPSGAAMREIAEGERARAAHAAVLAWEERQRWEKLLFRLKLGLAAAAAALVAGFYLSGVWRGLRRPDLSHLTDKNRPSPYHRPRDGK